MTIKETRPYVDWETIGNFIVDAFVAYGVPREDAEICADVLHYWQSEKIFTPMMSEVERANRQRGWTKAVEKAKNWED